MNAFLPMGKGFRKRLAEAVLLQDPRHLFPDSRGEQRDGFREGFRQAVPRPHVPGQKIEERRQLGENGPFPSVAVPTDQEANGENRRGCRCRALPMLDLRKMPVLRSAR